MAAGRGGPVGPRRAAGGIGPRGSRPQRVRPAGRVDRGGTGGGRPTGRPARLTSRAPRFRGRTMPDPTPALLPDAPIAVESARLLFRGPSIRRRGFPSLRRLPFGRLLLAFMMGSGPEPRDDAAIMLSHSDDDGATFDEPFPLLAEPGWNCLPMGGLAHLGGDRLRLIVGRISRIVARRRTHHGLVHGRARLADGGRTWSEIGTRSACSRRGRRSTARATRTGCRTDGSCGRSSGRRARRRLAERRHVDRSGRQRLLTGRSHRRRGRSELRRHGPRVALMTAGSSPSCARW